MERTAGVFGSRASPLESIPSTWKTFSHRTRDHLFDAANNVSRRQLLRHMDIQHVSLNFNSRRCAAICRGNRAIHARLCGSIRGITNAYRLSLCARIVFTDRFRLPTTSFQYGMRCFQIKITEDPIEHVHSQPGDIRYNNGF